MIQAIPSYKRRCSLNRAVFLDRDGVINQKAPEGQYVTHWEDFHVLPGAAEAIRLLNGAGFTVIVVTNQRCIAKGLITALDLKKMHQRMCAFLARDGATIDAIYYCPHDFGDSCDCRKPAPGMLLEAARAHKIDLTASWMIGDSDHDVEAGKNAGCKTVRLLDPEETPAESARRGPARNEADFVVTSLAEAARQVLYLEGAAIGSFTANPATI
jgi:D-glycero-D-manno-heptose 1,7-bisphosphate phosphatase